MDHIGRDHWCETVKRKNVGVQERGGGGMGRERRRGEGREEHTLWRLVFESPNLPKLILGVHHPSTDNRIFFLILY